MQVKDHYKILGVSPEASPEEIKKAYRTLAKQFHPDKNSNDRLSEEKFKSLQAAYYTLSDPKRRQQYNHLTYDEKHGLSKQTVQTVVTPATVFAKVKNLKKKVDTLDPHRLDRDKLFNKVQEILSPQNLVLIKKDAETPLKKAMMEYLLPVISLLEFTKQEQLYLQLQAILVNEDNLEPMLKAFQQKQKLSAYWKRFQLIVVAILVIIFCVIIYKLSF